MSILAGKIKYERGYTKVSHERLIEEDISRRLDLIKSRKGDQFGCMKNLSRAYMGVSSRNLLIEKDIKKHRLNCYIGGKLRILSTSRSSMLFTSITQMFEMLMSNNPDFITFFKNNIDMIMPDDYNSKKNKYEDLSDTYGNFFLIRAILLAIKGEFEDLKKRCLAYLEKPLKSNHYKYSELHYEFLLALSEKNVVKMKEAIDKMMVQNVARKFSNDSSFDYEFYLYVYVIMYAKIALYHGIDLEIDHEVAPKELIDNTPLESYEDPYDFMKDFDLETVTPEEWKKWKNSWNLNL